MAQHLHLPMIFSRVATHSLSCRRYILLKHTRQDCKNCNTRHNLLYNVIDASVFRWLYKQFFIIIWLIAFFCGKYRKVEFQVLARIALSTKVRSDYFSLVILKCFHSALMNRNYAPCATELKTYTVQHLTTMLQQRNRKGKWFGGPSASGKSVECLIVTRIHGVSGYIANELSGYSESRLSEEIDVMYSGCSSMWIASRT